MAPTKSTADNKSKDQSAKSLQKTQSTKQSSVVTNSLFSMRLFNAELDLPIVYHDGYNIRLMGLELSHRLDTRRYEKIANILNQLFRNTPFSRKRLFETLDGTSSTNENVVNAKRKGKGKDERRLRFLSPNRPVNLNELLIHHKQDYVSEIHENKGLVARITETWFIHLIPQYFVESKLLAPIKLQIAGTIFATHLAMQHGWSINLGGGFHTAFANFGETYCLFSDILLAMKYVWRKHPLQKFMIIDLDAHQGTGIARDLLDLSAKQREKVFMLDVFNSTIQPPDARADRGCHLRVDLPRFTGDELYLKRLNEALEKAFSLFKPTLIFYIAGQDVLKNDQLGLMNLTDECLRQRDELVFNYAIVRNKCPIVMLLGGGYLSSGPRVQAASIRSLFAKDLIWGGHKPGSRTLTRPKLKTIKSEPSAATVTIPRKQITLGSVMPEVDALSQSIEGSGGRKKTHILRVPETITRSAKQQQQQQQQQRQSARLNSGTNKSTKTLSPTIKTIVESKQSEQLQPEYQQPQQQQQERLNKQVKRSTN